LSTLARGIVGRAVGKAVFSGADRDETKNLRRQPRKSLIWHSLKRNGSTLYHVLGKELVPDETAAKKEKTQKVALVDLSPFANHLTAAKRRFEHKRCRPLSSFPSWRRIRRCFHFSGGKF